MDFVDRVLLLRDNSSNIQKLSVDNIKIQYNITYRFNTWISTSVLRNIQELSLRIYPATTFWKFPSCLNNCKILTKLVLEIVKYLPSPTTVFLPGPGSFNLPGFKSLSISAVEFGKINSIDGLISNERCLHVLETLILIDVHFRQDSLTISSLKLKHLRLESCRADSVDIHLDSPNLISFYYTGFSFCCCLFKHWIIEKNLSSLVKANVNVIHICVRRDSAEEIRDAKETANILRELHNVEELTLSLESLEIPIEAPELFENHSMRFPKLKCLKLWSKLLSLEVFGIGGIAYLLNACPNLETFCLRVGCQRWRYGNEENSSLASQGDCWGAVLSLKCLNFFEFQDVHASVNELKFIEILLSKAVVLEKLVIVFRFGKSCSDYINCPVKFKKKVLTFPRVSPTAAILFKYSGLLL